ncbi:uncharacterized protein MAM_06183 [Metarhizium album ARSEF 1941]|uniref:DUF7779 domain-containing protein n=1 Tax=Metarhizium album (strain ARSEF 1941) TaxID=1081103 RepID=A0A0B2WPY4_METAS|nr:uncharacterized protein MAM_06183 [Metarhizium album ARSEF 1941]KHN96078.1 hypothetical protein MAM_06183 [Metarhizium album ARSEF 1941]
MRCDHKVPICGRCSEKSIAHQCYYHPAPLTRPSRPRAGTGGNSINASSQDMTFTDGQVYSTQPLPTSAGTCAQNRILASSPSSIVVEPSYQFGLVDISMQAHTPLSPPASEIPIKLSGPRVDVALKEVLGKLSEIDLISALVRYWYETSPMCFLPAKFIYQALESLDLASSRLKQGFIEVGKLGADIIDATSKPLQANLDAGSSDPSSLFTTSSLRLEIIGLLLTTAALAALQIPAADGLLASVHMRKNDRRRFAASMLAASDSCIALCDGIFDINDGMIWLRLENLMLIMKMYGMKNLHRDAPEAPQKVTVLGEIRARVFAFSYDIDKLLSYTLEKPPRLPLHYCNRRLPLHLRDEHLLAHGPAQGVSISSLSSDGWSRDANFHPTAWLRARRILATSREEILSIHLGAKMAHDETVMKLRSISQHVQESWEKFPQYLRYDESCWDSPLSSSVCSTLLALYLEYLDLVLHVEKLIHATTTKNNTAALMAATSLLTAVVTSSKQLLRCGAYADHVWNLSFYGLAAGTPLVTALKESAELGRNVACPLSWSQLCRELSVLATDLEGVVQSGEATCLDCKEGSELLSSTLDQALNACIVTATTTSSYVLSGGSLQSFEEFSNETTDSAEIFHGFPLGLQRAFYFMRSQPCSAQDYVSLWGQRRRRLERTTVPDYSKTIFDAWDISLGALSGDAANLLDLRTFFDPDSAPLGLLGESGALSPFTSFLADHLQSLDATNCLARQSLVRVTTPGPVLSLHRFFQDVVLSRLMANMPKYDPVMHVGSWEKCELFIPHPEHMYGRMSGGASATALNLLVSITWRIAGYCHETGQYSLGESLLRKAKMTATSQSGVRPSLLSKIRYYAGRVCQETNEPGQAVASFRMAIDLWDPEARSFSCRNDDAYLAIAIPVSISV